MNREQRDRLTETFVAVSDALQRSAVPTWPVAMDKAPQLPRPSYLPEVPPQTVGQYRAALRKLAGFGILKKVN